MSLPFIALTAAGIACILYGIMVMLIRSGTMFFAVWLALGGFLVLLGRLTRIRFWDMMPRFVKAVLVCVLVVGLLIFGACEVMVLCGFGTSAPPGADYLIVLGAQVRPDGPSRDRRQGQERTYFGGRRHEAVSGRTGHRRRPDHR